MPCSWWSQNLPVNWRSVAAWRVTWYSIGSSRARRSASVLVTFSVMSVSLSGSGRAAHLEVGRPVRRQRRTGFVFGLFVERALQHRQQLAHAGVVAVLRLLDGYLRQVI